MLHNRVLVCAIGEFRDDMAITQKVIKRQLGIQATDRRPAWRYLDQTKGQHKEQFDEDEFAGPDQTMNGHDAIERVQGLDPTFKSPVSADPSLCHLKPLSQQEVRLVSGSVHS